MASKARREIYREGEIGIYHCWSRCVQRSFLFGRDRYTGEDFSYRRPIVEDLIYYQAGVFAVDLANYTVMSNHMHLILRTRPDVVATWSDEQVALNWKRAWPDWEEGTWTRVPTDEEVRELLANPGKLAYARKALSSLSWYMARVKETLAKLFNGQRGTDGHFWAERFGSREITDEEALLACMLYVDTNQMKAGLATSLEGSECSGIAARLKAARAPEVAASLKKFHKSGKGAYELSAEQLDCLFADMMLSPIRVEGPTMTETALNAAREKESAPDTAGTTGTDLDAASSLESDTDAADTVIDGEAERIGETAIGVNSQAGGEESAPEAAQVTREGEAAGGTETVMSVTSQGGGAERAPETAELTRGGDAEGGAGTAIYADSSEAGDRPAPEAGDAPEAGEVTRGEGPREAENHSIYRRYCGEGLGAGRRRASDNPILPMPFSQYREIVEWVAEQTRIAMGQPASVPDWLVQYLQSHGTDPDNWLEAVNKFHEWFGWAVGSSERLRELLERTGNSRIKGMRNCRATFG